ncbi:DNA/RNA polymerases superfamily protein [Gossypium australe]|uniref:DNA/RNA polymerases superfamily protein n=1 Tax=Gossypium australe TaxID=47621 RepID=A0A5B6WHA0_9ROSI|nr:DNA/RNA polymerases superfamily protein [Gossypium australe]
MDWLSEHRVKVDCKAKLVTLCGVAGSEVVVVGEKFELLSNEISSLHTEKLVQKGCKAYIAYVLNADGKEIWLDEIRVISSFLDVFPEELPGLPLDREVEFGNELYPSTAPVPVAPYLIAPKELKELKLQL